MMTSGFSAETSRSAHLLMKEVLALKDLPYVDGSRVRSVVDKLTLTKIEQKIQFLQELHGIVRRLPLKIFTNDENRLKLVAAIQQSLDTAIDQEEEMLEAEEQA